MEKQKCPEVRFRKFEENWEAQPLKNIFGKIRNAFVGTATPYYVKKGNFYLESNNVKDGLINRKTQIFIDDYFYFKQKDKWLKTGDLVMVQSGHVGHAAVIPEELNNSAAHALIMFSDYKVPTNPYFLNYQLQTNNAKSAIEKFTTGNTIKHILSSDMKEFLGFFTNFDEQLKVGQFFQNLDQSIALHEKKLAQTQNFKKAMLEKMFPKEGSNCPEIRLKGFSGDWDEFKLEDLGDFKNGMNMSKDSMGYGNPFVNIQHIFESNEILDNNLELVNASANQQKDYSLQLGDVLFVRSSVKLEGVGDTAVVIKNIKGATYSGFIIRFRSNVDIDLDFKKVMFLTPLVRKQVLANATTSANTNINQDNLKKISTLLPTIEEQTKIGKFFSLIDVDILLLQQQLQTLKNLKQAFLEKMFV